MTVRTENLLAEAGQVIREKGWCQRTAVNGADQLCLVGALGVVCLMDSADGVASYYESLDLVKERLFAKYEWDETVAMWNDVPGRTVDEVLAILEGEG